MRAERETKAVFPGVETKLSEWVQAKTVHFFFFLIFIIILSFQTTRAHTCTITMLPVWFQMIFFACFEGNESNVWRIQTYIVWLQTQGPPPPPPPPSWPPFTCLARTVPLQRLCVCLFKVTLLSGLQPVVTPRELLTSCLLYIFPHCCMACTEGTSPAGGPGEVERKKGSVESKRERAGSRGVWVVGRAAHPEESLQPLG